MGRHPLKSWFVFLHEKHNKMCKSTQVVSAGQVCLNPDCPDYGQVGAGQLVRYGKDRRGGQRHKCKTCQKCFSERKGTIFYRKKTSESLIVSSLSSIGKGARLSTVSTSSGKKADTIGNWVKEAGQHSERLENALLRGYEVGASEVDGLWSFVKNKGEKK